MPSTYTLISSNVLATSAASVTFSAIPSTYTDLVVRISARSTRAAISETLDLRINADSSTLYSYTYLYATGDPAGSFRRSSQTSLFISTMNAVDSTANTFTSAEIYIPSYTASQNKPLGSFGAFENRVSTIYEIDANAHLYRSTSAITSLTLSSALGSSNFVAGSSFYLYGIKNS
jgi:hypothetical protein